MIAIATEGDTFIAEHADDVIYIPHAPTISYPFSPSFRCNCYHITLPGAWL